jgi:hypothetical protein
MVDFGIGEAALAMSAAGAASGAAGSIFGGMAQSGMANYQSQIATINAQIAKQNAAYDVAVGETQAQQQGMKIRAQIGATRAQQGASGLDVNSGTNVSVRASEAEIGSYDQSLIRSNASKAAYGDEVISMQDTAQSQLDQMAASNYSTAGYIGAATSILGGAGSFGSKYLQMQKMGMVSG